MPFVIYEQGMRIRTPLASVFPPRTVEQLTPVEKAARISRNDQVKPEGRTQIERELDTYRQISDGEETRQRLRYAEDIMVTTVLTVVESESVERCWNLIQSRGFHHVPVLDEHRKLIGIVSDRDILVALTTIGEQVMQQRIATIMKTRVLTATPKTEIRLMAGLMAENGIGSIPVVNEDDRVEGIVTRTDILLTMVNQAPLELWS